MKRAFLLLPCLVLLAGLAALSVTTWQAHGAARSAPRRNSEVDRVGAEAQTAFERVCEQVAALEGQIARCTQAAAACHDAVQKRGDSMHRMREAVARQAEKLERLQDLLEGGQGAELPDGQYVSKDTILKQLEWENDKHQRWQKGELDGLEARLSHAQLLERALRERLDLLRPLHAILINQRKKLGEVLKHPDIQIDPVLHDCHDVFEIEHDLMENEQTIHLLQSKMRALRDSETQAIFAIGPPSPRVLEGP